MALGALLDAGLDPAWLDELAARLGFPDVTVRVRKVSRCSVAATKVDFDIPPEDQDAPHGHHVGRLIEVVRGAALSETVKDKAVHAFELLGEAEGRVHGVPPSGVHLHEVGAIDAVLDIVGVVEGFERLGVEAVYNLPVAVGDGWVATEHGTLPAPAPATTVLLEGITVSRTGPVTGEATTPTGATLVRALSLGAPPSTWRMTAVAWGAGGRDPDHYPNALRLILAEAAPEAGLVEVIATDVDDLQPEYLEPLREAMMDAGALDCVVWPTQGKKGRVSLRLEALAAPDRTQAVVEALFANSTTSGVRRWLAVRSTLARREFTVELDGSTRVRIKAWKGPAGTRLKPEYSDVLQAAADLGIPALEVARQAMRRAEAVLGDGEMA